MRSERLLVALVAAAVAVALPPAARASTEPALADARTTAMGSTGVAHVDNGSAVFHNPATLAEVGGFVATLSLAASRTTFHAPFVDASSGVTTRVASTSAIAPLFLLGWGYRLGDRIVVGGAAYPTSGFSGEYEHVAALGGRSYKLQSYSIEASNGLSFALGDSLSLGVAYRVTYAKTSNVVPLTLPNGAPISAEADLEGTNFFGLIAGVVYRPLPELRLGATWRSRVTTELGGTTAIGGTTHDTTSTFASPHAFKVGGALTLLGDRLTLAAEGKLALFADANKEIVTTVQGRPSTVTPLGWRNVYAANVGAEYFVVPKVAAARLGAILTTSATPEAHASPFFTPPGILTSVHGGGGVTLGRVTLDAGGYVSFGGSDVAARAGSSAADPGVAGGRYDLLFWLLALSATYRA